MTDATAPQTGPLLAADGTPLKTKLRESMRASRMRAFGLVLPLLLFVLASFVIPILVLLWQGVYNGTYAENMTRSAPIVREWDGESAPTEAMAEAMVLDMIDARKAKTIGKVATRVNRELSGTRSLFTKSARRAAKMEAPYLAALEKTNEDWADVET